MASYGEAVQAAARAVFEEYEQIECRGRGELRWEDLHEDAKANWAAVARAAINAYDEVMREARGPR